jgi:hypothetical protein
MILTEPVLDVIRRELRRVSPEVRIDVEEIKTVLTNEVIKREVMEGDKAAEAKKKIARTQNRQLRASAAKEQKSESPVPVETSAEAPDLEPELPPSRWVPVD